MRAERRWHVAEKVAAARATALAGGWPYDVGAQPVAARFTRRVDAWHGQAGQVLHRFTSEAAQPSPFSPSESRERAAEPPCGHARPPESPQEKRLAGRQEPWAGGRAGAVHVMAGSLCWDVVGVKGQVPPGMVV